jgi:hypothetical protein
MRSMSSANGQGDTLQIREIKDRDVGHDIHSMHIDGKFPNVPERLRNMKVSAYSIFEVDVEVVNVEFFGLVVQCNARIQHHFDVKIVISFRDELLDKADWNIPFQNCVEFDIWVLLNQAQIHVRTQESHNFDVAVRSDNTRNQLFAR